jgi:sugar phosphate isomerase/epimerase
MPLTRRHFLQITAAATASTLVGTAFAELPANWTLGCFNRPWRKWTYDETLAAMKAAGYGLTGLLSTHPGETFTAVEATDDSLRALKDRIASRGLTVNMSTMQLPKDLSAADAIPYGRKQIDNAHKLGLSYMLSFGIDPVDQYDHYLKWIGDAAAFAEDKGIQVAIKPHGGITATAADIVRCLEKVNHKNLTVWYDAGNMLHYTGKDPVEELKPLAKHVTGFCAKDCLGMKGDVMIPFGSGKVDFAGVFAVLKSANFRGPIWMETCGGGMDLEAVNASAKANYEFLQKTIASAAAK